MSGDGRSFADILASTRRQQTDRRSEADDLPRVGRPFRASYDSDCASMIAGRDCNGEIMEGDEIAYVDDEVACEACREHAQGIRDDYFENR